MMQLYLKAFDLTMMMAVMVDVVRMTNHSDKSDRHLLIVHYLLSSVPGVAAHAFSPSSWEAKDRRQKNLCDFEASFAYMVSSRIFRTTQTNTVSKHKNNNKTTATTNLANSRNFSARDIGQNGKDVPCAPALSMRRPECASCGDT